MEICATLVGLHNHSNFHELIQYVDRSAIGHIPGVDGHSTQIRTAYTRIVVQMDTPIYRALVYKAGHEASSILD